MPLHVSIPRRYVNMCTYRTENGVSARLLTAAPTRPVLGVVIYLHLQCTSTSGSHQHCETLEEWSTSNIYELSNNEHRF